MAKSFLAWGVITLIYCIMAVLAYMMLDENQEWKHYEKIATIIYLAVRYHYILPCFLNKNSLGFWWVCAVVCFVVGS